jgi:hypothetical protein
MSLPVKLWPGSDNNLSNPAKTILRNRGIDDYKEYMNLSDKALYSPYLLKNIEAAADLFIKHIQAIRHNADFQRFLYWPQDIPAMFFEQMCCLPFAFQHTRSRGFCLHRGYL